MNPEVYTKIVRPHPLLQPHLNYIGVRSFDTGKIVFPKAIIAEQEIQINFFLKGKEDGFNKIDKTVDYTYNKKNKILCYLTGLQSSTKGFVVMKGETTIMTLHFKPTGFYNIFKISPRDITNRIGRTEDLLGAEIRFLYEEMLEAGDIHNSIKILEHYLINKLQLSVKSYRHEGIRYAANRLVATNGNYAIGDLARECNMSIQTLEVRFAEMVGTDPKSFASIVRFNTAVVKKLYNSSLTWSSIAHDCGYYDQMHLIKSFKKLSGLTPKEFMRVIHPPYEEFTS